MFDFLNTYSKQGTAGLGIAISFYTLKGNTVALPINDTQKYDLFVDDGNSLKKIQVKTTSVKRNNYIVSLQTCGGNRSGNNTYKFDKFKVDGLFVICENGDIYDIPATIIDNKTSLNLNEKFTQYKYNFSINRAEIEENLIDYSVNRMAKKYNCINCGIGISSHTKTNLCRKCSDITNRKVDRPSKEDLISLLTGNTLSSISNKFEVSIRAIKQWCLYYDIDYKPLIKYYKK